jgi:hypothetical protein
MTNGYSEAIGVECKPAIPVRRDKRLSDGEPHAPSAWDWFEGELYEGYGTARWSSALEVATWRDKSGQPIRDESRVYTIAIPDEKVDELRKLLMQACMVFCQECIYLTVGGRAELVYPPAGTWPQLNSQ